ncbi:hypothetical protein ACPOL_3695 [Acidisarcina polymorpha]|uniref:Uncharacterized protein n=1 Tax=Acidisarcina polymorpha TaxID=2211140 RepID=A0A2Z5G377_9BACT|nr:hypothetical protein ACPOL_3695 [Acidisarcina polymorpha]
MISSYTEPCDLYTQISRLTTDAASTSFADGDFDNELSYPVTEHSQVVN